MATQKTKPDPQDKDSFLELGEEREREFVSRISDIIGVDAKINPKKEDDPTVIDLIVDGELSDLKVQETPFFTAKSKFGIDPQWAVTFNKIDYERYKEKGGDMNIFFWINWKREERVKGQKYGTYVNGMSGVWMVPFSKIEEWVENEKVTYHKYKNRHHASRNSNGSYGLDLRWMECLHSVGPFNLEKN